MPVEYRPRADERFWPYARPISCLVANEAFVCIGCTLDKRSFCADAGCRCCAAALGRNR